MTRVKTYFGVDRGFDCVHVPVVAVMRVKLKNLRKKKKVRVR